MLQRTACILFLIISLSHSLVGQDNFDSLYQETLRHLRNYEKIDTYNYGELQSIASFEFTTKELHDIYLTESGNSGTKIDSAESFTLLETVQYALVSCIESLIAYPNFTSEDILNRLENTELALLRSPDDKVITLSLDEKTGGSYRSRFSWIVDAENRDSSNLGTTLSASDGYWKIDTAHVSGRVLYILSGGVRGCTSCFQSDLDIITKDESGWTNIFSASINTRHWDSSVYYDEDLRSVIIDYEPDDLTLDCYCNDDPEESSEKCYCEMSIEEITSSENPPPGGY